MRAVRLRHYGGVDVLQVRRRADRPSGLASVITDLGAQVTDHAIGDEVLGWSWERSSHAEQVVVPATSVVAKPPRLAWDVAGALYVAGYVQLAVELGVPTERINTVIDFDAAERFAVGTRRSADGTSREVLAELAEG